MAVRPSVVLIISDASSFLIKSTMCGRPSATLLTERTSKPASFNALAVPLVAASVKPESTGRLATSIAAGLSASLTLNNASPDVGVTSPAPSCAAGKCVGKGRAGSHNLTRRLHFWAKNGVNTREFIKRQYCFFHAVVVGNNFCSESLRRK